MEGPDSRLYRVEEAVSFNACTVPNVVDEERPTLHPLFIWNDKMVISRKRGSISQSERTRFMSV